MQNNSIHYLTLSVFCVLVFFICTHFFQNDLGSTEPAAGTRETTYTSERAAGPTEVSVRSDPVFTDPTPAAA